jgi:hypothetical protein
LDEQVQVRQYDLLVWVIGLRQHVGVWRIDWAGLRKQQQLTNKIGVSDHGLPFVGYLMGGW